MKINLNIRPLITDKDERFENGFWEGKGILDLKEATKNIELVNWIQAAKELRKTIIENDDLTIYKILEPAFNLHNNETHAELFVGLLDDDFFDITLATFKEKEMDEKEISGLNFSQIKKIVSLFYQEKYKEIKLFSEVTNNSKSEIKELLLDRDNQQATEKRSNNFKQIGIYLVIGIIIYLVSKMI